MQRPRAAFRPDVEGLRGLAVLLVVFYHLKVPGFSGGFAGVDIFFVLSGFLITRLLLKEGEQSGRIDLPSFFARRVRRLLPMLAVVVACTGFLSRALLPSSDWEGIGQDIAWSSVWLANWNLMQKGVDYLGGSLLPSPLQHLWSLAVEEQFYLCWPLFLAGGWRIFGRSVARAEVFLWTLLSLAYARWLGQQSPAVAFFSSPARAWELGLGALLVFAPPAPARRWLGWLGLVGIVGSVISFGEQTPWPFPGALLPTIGTALVIFADAEEPLLSSGPMPWFGTLSYSWYLWHWPMLCFASILQTSAWTLATLSLLLAWASHRWIETPLRTSSLFQGSPYRNLTIGLLTSLTLLTGGRLLASAEKIDETPLQAHRIGPGQYQIDAGLTVDLNHNLVTVAPDRPPDRPSEARRRPTFAASQGCSPETWTSLSHPVRLAKPTRDLPSPCSATPTRPTGLLPSAFSLI